MLNRRRNWLHGAILCAALWASVAQGQQGTVLEVIDAYADVHSGPGRGYPVFYTIEQGEKIEVLTRRPGWYEIRSANGKVGWTTAAQISRTIQTTGEPADLPSVGYGDYIKNSWVTGFSAGTISGSRLGGYDLYTINAGYRVLSWFAADVEFGRAFGPDATAEMYGFNLLVEPFSDWKFSPFLSLGNGDLSVNSKPQFPVSKVDSTYNAYAIGASYYLGRNFVLKAEYRQYDISTNSETAEAWKIGFNTFF